MKVWMYFFIAMFLIFGAFACFGAIVALMSFLTTGDITDLIGALFFLVASGYAFFSSFTFKKKAKKT